MADAVGPSDGSAAASRPAASRAQPAGKALRQEQEGGTGRRGSLGQLPRAFRHGFRARQGRDSRDRDPHRASHGLFMKRFNEMSYPGKQDAT